MVFLQGHACAPEFSDVASGPYGQCDAGGDHRDGNRLERLVWRNKPPAQYAQVEPAGEDENGGDPENSHGGEPRSRRLSALLLLDAQSADQPVEDEDRPEKPD